MQRIPPLRATTRSWTTLNAQTRASSTLARRGGSSRLRLLQIVRRAEHSVEPKVLGLDIDNTKLQACNADGKVNCAKADLRSLFKKCERPLVEGVQMVDILEHINMPVPAGRVAAIPLARRRTFNGDTFDTARHGVAMQLWKASCAAASRFCVMEGPSFDGEHALRALGFMRYYEAWRGHTCHFNSTSLMHAMTSSDRPHRPGASLVMLYERIPSTSSDRVLRQPPAESDRHCSGSKELGCDRHPARQPEKPQSRGCFTPRCASPKTGQHST